MNLSTIRTKDAKALIEKMKTANINEVKTMIVNNYRPEKASVTKLVRYTIALKELSRRGLDFQYTPNCFNFVSK